MESRCSKKRIVTALAVAVLVAIVVSVVRKRRSGDAVVIATGDDAEVGEILT